MYPLTDYTPAQLRLFSQVIGKQIDDLLTQIVNAKAYIPEGETLDWITRKDNAALSELREFHVHLLTALAMSVGVENALSN